MRLMIAACLVLVALSSALAHAQAVARTAIGVTRAGKEIEVFLSPSAADLTASRVLVIGGHDGKAASTKLVQDLVTLVARAGGKEAGPDGCTYIPNVFPSGVPAEIKENPFRGYPPEKGYYDHPSAPEQRYLWRWAGMFGPDLVICVRSGDTTGFWLGGPGKTVVSLRAALAETWKELPKPAEDDFCRQVAEKGIQDIGTAPCLVVQIAAGKEDGEFNHLASVLRLTQFLEASPVHRELQRREKLTASEIAGELALSYGKDLKQVAYIPALPLIGRIRVLERSKKQRPVDPQRNPFAGVGAAHLQNEIENSLADYVSGKLNPIPKSGSDQAGHLLFAELAKRSEGKDRERWIELCRVAADQIFDKEGKPLPLMPYHNEMSDAVFMATPIICATGKLTGEKKYFDAAVTHFRNMKKLCLRADGIYRHSPLDEAAWGRGNGFPAMGLAWALSEFPEDHADFPELKQDFQSHIAALLKHQDEFGCWHQVIDKAGSYREFSVTCMIGWALKRGIDRGWLDKATHQKPLDRAWIAAQQRIGPKGVVVDICTGTGKQKSLRDYYDRPAIWGVDARGGAMALMFATEMMNAE